MNTGTTNYTPLTIDPATMIQVYEKELSRVQHEVSQYKKLISLLKKSGKNGVVNQLTEFDIKVSNLKWRKEIRICLNYPNQFLATSAEIAACVVVRNELPAIDRNIKLKISTTLSMLHSEKEIGRFTSIGGEYYYGRKEYFEEDLTTLNTKYVSLIK